MIEIEMKKASTLRDIQLLMFALGVCTPIPVIVSPYHCRAKNQKRFGPVPVTSWVTAYIPKNNKVLLLKVYQKGEHDERK